MKKEHPIKSLKRAGVPLAFFETSDPAMSVRETLRALNSKADSMAIMNWDCIAGLEGLNNVGTSTAIDIANAAETEPRKVTNPADLLGLLALPNVTPANALVFMHNAHLMIGDAGVKQAVWNLRDKFKSVGSLLLMMGPAVTLPAELKHDVVLIDEALPNGEEIAVIVKQTMEDAGLPMPEKKTEDKIVYSLLGLNGYSSEQNLAMSLDKSGVDMPSLLIRRRKFLSQGDGLEIRDDRMRFSDIAGYQTIKEAITNKINGRRPPRLVLWFDEVEKAFAASTSDSSGTTQDQLAFLLAWFQDKLNADAISAMMLVGFPGTGKSAISMSVRNEADCECARMDMGAMKGSLVGQSERTIRDRFKTVDALSGGGHIMVVSTCNSMANIPAAFISRHAFGTYFFDLPSKEENLAMWKLKCAKYELPIDDIEEMSAATVGWTGREINQVCFLASDMGISKRKATGYVAPFCRSNAQDITSLRAQATGRWTSASSDGFYNGPAESKGSARKFEV